MFSLDRRKANSIVKGTEPSPSHGGNDDETKDGTNDEINE